MNTRKYHFYNCNLHKSFLKHFKTVLRRFRLLNLSPRSRSNQRVNLYTSILTHDSRVFNSHDGNFKRRCAWFSLEFARLGSSRRKMADTYPFADWTEVVSCCITLVANGNTCHLIVSENPDQRGITESSKSRLESKPHLRVEKCIWRQKWFCWLGKVKSAECMGSESYTVRDKQGLLLEGELERFV